MAKSNLKWSPKLRLAGSEVLPRTCPERAWTEQPPTLATTGTGRLWWHLGLEKPAFLYSHPNGCWIDNQKGEPWFFFFLDVSGYASHECSDGNLAKKRMQVSIASVYQFEFQLSSKSACRLCTVISCNFQSIYTCLGSSYIIASFYLVPTFDLSNTPGSSQLLRGRWQFGLRVPWSLLGILQFVREGIVKHLRLKGSGMNTWSVARIGSTGSVLLCTVLHFIKRYSFDYQKCGLSVRQANQTTINCGHAT